MGGEYRRQRLVDVLFWWRSSQGNHNLRIRVPGPWEDKMKKFALILLAAASLVGTASVATAQWGGYYYGDRYYGDRYRERYYDDDRYYRRRQYRSSRVDCYGRVCPQGFTVQDCVCKPYRGY